VTDQRPSFAALQDEERRARNRLAVFKAKLYAQPAGDTLARQRRLAELERRWQAASERLREARDAR
jgi:hypothetical protein